MQLNSLRFLFVFLPVMLVGFYAIARCLPLFWARLFLIIGSLAFCGWHTPWFSLVLIGSTAITWCSSRLMTGLPPGRGRQAACVLGLVGSLGNLAFWKYSSAVLQLIGVSAHEVLPAWSLVLPLGISFYTFQQLTYVLDVYRERTDCARLLDYVLYVFFFPQLVIGPIVRHDELIPQLNAQRFGSLRLQNLIVGSGILVVGLAKKVILADNLAVMVDPVYAAADRGTSMCVIATLTAGLAYSLQLYLDFSGYSDMAVGLGRMFGVRLPANFHSPFKAVSVSDFWRRWHITLTRILTPLVYTPVSLWLTRAAAARGWSGIRLTVAMTAPASLVVFVLIGLWHAPNVPFLIVGVAHAVFVTCESLWKSTVRVHLPRSLAMAVTFGLVASTIACFRAPDADTLLVMARGLAGASGWGTWQDIDHALLNIALLVFSLGMCFCCPNTGELFARYRPVIYSYPEHVPTDRHRRIRLRSAFAAGFLLVLSCLYLLEGRSVFLYQGF